MEKVFLLDQKFHGQGPVKFQWQKKSCNFLAVVGINKLVRIYDRKGQQVETISLPGLCTGLEWDPDGETLAIVQDTTGVMFQYDTTTKKTTTIESGLKGITFCRWAKSGDVLAIGTNKGNLLLYNRRTSRKIPILGKHTKSIIDGVWGDESLLACASDDKTFSITNTEGDTIYHSSATPDITLMKFHQIYRSADDENIVPCLSMILGGKTLYIHRLDVQRESFEITFNSKHGNIVNFVWVDNDVIAIAFSNGFGSIVSVVKQKGKELGLIRDFKDSMAGLVIAPSSMGKVAFAGDGSVKVHELTDFKEINAIIPLDELRGTLDGIEWSSDGQFLSVSTKLGSIHVFLTKLPQIGFSSLGKIGFLSALTEISIVNPIEAPNMNSPMVPLDTDVNIVKFNIAIEPTFLSLGPDSIILGVNNQVWIYPNNEENLMSKEPSFTKRDLEGNVKDLQINSHFIIALLDSYIRIYSISGDSDKDFRIPERTDTEVKITCQSLSSEILVVGTSTGLIQYYTVEDQYPISLATEYRHKHPIRVIFTEPGGAHSIFQDEKGTVFLFSPVEDSVNEIKSFKGRLKCCLWDIETLEQRRIFTLIGENEAQVFEAAPFVTKGDILNQLETTKYQSSLKPLTLKNGVLFCLTLNGKINAVQLASHDEHMIEENDEKMLLKYYCLGKLSDIRQKMRGAPDTKIWESLLVVVLNRRDLEMANSIYRYLGETARVMHLESISKIEDRSLLCGHIAVLLGAYKTAQDYFLSSSYPKAALDLRCDLMEWDQALSLASKLAPEEIGPISLLYAQQLESRGSYAEALDLYNKALVEFKDHPPTNKRMTASEPSNQIKNVESGLARVTLRLGDIPRGMRLLQNVTDVQVFLECAMILEALKQTQEAALMYEKSKNYEKAAELYIKAKKFGKVGELLTLFNSPTILFQYAKAKEAEGQYKDAALGYERANDLDNLVRIYVTHLKKIDEAVEIVRKTKSKEGAKLISKFFQSVQDYKSVVEFCLLAGLREDALNYAKTYNQMEFYAELIQEEATPESFLSLAAFFEQNGQLFLAAKYLSKAGEYTKALRFLMQIPEDDQAIDLAVDLVGLAKSDQLTNQLVSYLMGERDGIPKEAKYIFRLYMSMGKYIEAGKTAVMIAVDEQTEGNYRQAHEFLLNSYKSLVKVKARIPTELDRLLMLLHSYILVKLLVRMEDHETGARMLVRVANNISKFPQHIVPILTSTVIECHRSGMKKSAFQFASILCRPEHRANLDEKFKRKIELIVRRREDEEKEENKTPCPNCNEPLAESELDCISCKSHVPYCIASGLHVIKDDFTWCPNCEMPAISSRLQEVVKSSEECPMCEFKLDASQLIKQDYNVYRANLSYDPVS